MCVCIRVWVYACVPLTNKNSQSSQKSEHSEGIRSSGMELYTRLWTSMLGAGIWIWILCKSSKYSKLLSHLLSLIMWVFYTSLLVCLLCWLTCVWSQSGFCMYFVRDMILLCGVCFLTSISGQCWPQADESENFMNSIFLV